jgi:hypothetical protein
MLLPIKQNLRLLEISILHELSKVSLALGNPHQAKAFAFKIREVAEMIQRYQLHQQRQLFIGQSVL